MEKLKFSKPIKGFVQNNGLICGTCGISFSYEKLLKHWVTKNCRTKRNR